jgi:hypothetical protein
MQPHDIAAHSERINRVSFIMLYLIVNGKSAKQDLYGSIDA